MLTLFLWHDRIWKKKFLDFSIIIFGWNELLLCAWKMAAEFPLFDVYSYKFRNNFLLFFLSINKNWFIVSCHRRRRPFYIVKNPLFNITVSFSFFFHEKNVSPPQKKHHIEVVEC